MNLKLTAGGFYGMLIILLSAWILQAFLEALLAACATAIATWPLYRQFTTRLPRRMGRSATSLIFTFVMTLFVLVPMMLAFGAVLSQGHELLLDIAAADKKGIAIPHEQRTDPAALLGWAQSLGQFMARHMFIIGFTVLVLFFLYQEGESLAQGCRTMLRHRIGERAEGYIDLAVRAVRASVNSMLVVGLFDGFASWAVYVLAGVPHAAVWAAITGSLALVPFLGYGAVIALALQLAMTGAATPAVLSFGLGCAVLFCGDKIVRPAVAAEGTHLPFVWVLMGCLGGFEVLGLVGLVVGPVVLTLAGELWAQRVRDLALSDPGASASRTGDGA